MMSNRQKRVFIIAGETSGDHHAASLVNRLKKGAPEIQFSGLGGPEMAKAGVDVFNDLANHGVTGFTEVVKKYPLIKRAFKQLLTRIETDKPDLILLIDYPGFNLRVAKAIKDKNIPVLYYISPQLWAWKAKRINIIKECISHMAVIFPFEKDLYLNHKVPVSFVGHPLAKNITPSEEKLKLCKKEINYHPDKLLIALLPGSRENEIKRLLPVMLEACQKLSKKDPTHSFVLPLAPGLSRQIIAPILKQTPLESLTLITGKAREAMALANIALVASGTASLECALIKTPMIVVYKTSQLTYSIAKQLIKIKLISLANIILNKYCIPELIQDDCNADNLANEALTLLHSPRLQSKMKDAFNQIDKLLSNSNIDCTIDELVLKLCSYKTVKKPQQIEKTT